MNRRISITSIAVILLLGLFGLTSFLLVQSGSAEQSSQSSASYVGAENCKMCHKEEYEGWKGSKHANAFDSLLDSEKGKKECVNCHVTGFDEGGYALDKDDEENQKFQNVQCESCHGPGSTHVEADMKNKAATIKTSPDCAKCHNPHVDFGAKAEKLRSE